MLWWTEVAGDDAKDFQRFNVFVHMLPQETRFFGFCLIRTLHVDLLCLRVRAYMMGVECSSACLCACWLAGWLAVCLSV